MALKLKGSTSGFVAIDAPSVAGNNTLILPENTGSAGQILANDITAGVTTFTQVTVSRNGDLTVPGTISIGGTLTYEDVTSVDSVGIITARTNIILGDSLKHLGDENTLISFPANDTITAQTSGTERVRIDSNGAVNIGAEAANTTIQASGPFSGSTPKLEIKLGGASNSYARLINIANPSGATGSETLGRVGIKLALGNESNSTETAKAGIIYAESTSTFNNAVSLCLATNNAERMRVTSDGKIGIGINDPKRFVHLSSNNTVVALTDTVASTDEKTKYILSDAGVLAIGKLSDDYNTATEHLRIDSSGRLGLGENSPGGYSSGANNLVITAASGSNAGITINNDSGGTDSGAIFFAHGSGASAVGRIRYYHSDDHMDFYTANTERMRIASDGQLTVDKGAPSSSNQVIGRFQAQSSRALDIVWHDSGSLMGFDTPGNHSYIFKCNGTERARITSGGTFGLNTNGDPTERVHFEHDQNITVLAECNTSGSGKNAAYRLKSADSSADWYMQTGHVTSGGLRFYDGNAGAERLRITSGGIVNISSTGNSLDQTGYRFQLTGSGGGEAASMAIKNEGSHPAKLHLMSGHGNWSVGNSVTVADALEFRDESGAGTRMYIDSAGNAIFNHRVGINFANPGARFVVSQNANQLEPMRVRDANNTNAVTHYISFRKQDNEKGSIKGDRGSTSYNTNSDYRLKQNVTSISDGITRIKQLLPKKFSFIEDENNTLRDGFLAHEVYSSVPEAVDGTKDAVDSDNKPVYQGLDYSKIVPLLTAALQEAIAKIETLETKVAALEGS